MKSIKLDCAPGALRPGDLIEGVLKGTGLKANQPVSKLFGNWVWEFDKTDIEWKKIVKVISDRIKSLYNQGLIRYGSW